MAGNHRDLLLEGHFSFGKNWASYASALDADAIVEARKGLAKLLDKSEIVGASLLDLGCGSGVHSIAALALGASRVFAVDIDPDSVETTTQQLREHCPSASWRSEVVSVFDLNAQNHGRFDIVYSWGVLHHTGDLKRAIEIAASLVNPGGLFAFALYRPTRLDSFWIPLKRTYSRASVYLQKIIRAAYILAFRTACVLRARSFSQYVASYKTHRGMSFYHDVHDWLGGYPYQSIAPVEVARQMDVLGFEQVRVFVRSGDTPVGWLGSGCDEYVYRKRQIS